MQMIQQQFEGRQMRVIQRDGQPWFVLADVCEVLELTSPHKVAARLDEDERTQTPVIDALGRSQDTTVINESGLYAVILRSDKPQARAFRKWITNEVLPVLHRTGSYTVPAVSTPTAPALISARLIGASTGQSAKAVGRALKRHGIAPTHHFLEPLCRAPAYLWPLKEIEAFYADWEFPRDFVPFAGEAQPGVAPVERMFTAAKRAGNKRKPLPTSKSPAQQPLFFTEVERIGAEMGAAIAKRLTEEFIRDELPQRIQAEMTRRVSA